MHGSVHARHTAVDPARPPARLSEIGTTQRTFTVGCVCVCVCGNLEDETAKPGGLVARGFETAQELYKTNRKRKKKLDTAWKY